MGDRQRGAALRKRVAVGMTEFIREFGFKHWYQRMVLEGRTYLVTSFLGMATAFAGLDFAASGSGAAHSLHGLTAAAIGVLLVVVGLRRYFYLLTLAETMSDHATCPQCRAYATFRVMSINAAAADEAAPRARLAVKCRRCGSEWKM